MCLSLFLEKFNFHYTFQGKKYANGICSFYTIFNILFCFKKPFYAPCESWLYSMIQCCNNRFSNYNLYVELITTTEVAQHEQTQYIFICDMYK